MTKGFRIDGEATPEALPLFVRAPTPYQILQHAKEHGELVSQAAREDSTPMREVGSLTPEDGDPETTKAIGADRPILPIYKPAIPPMALQVPKPPFKLDR